MQTNTSKNTKNGNRGHTFTRTTPRSQAGIHALDFGEFKQCPPLERTNEIKTFEAHDAKRECQKTAGAYRMWSELRSRNERIDTSARFNVCLHTKHSLTSSSNTKKGKSAQIVTATQAKRLEMKWRLSREESLVNLYKRQGAVFTAQASSNVTITADSYRLDLKERAFPKGNYITVELHTTLGTILVHNAERRQPQRSVALGTGVSSRLATSTPKSSDRRTGPREEYCTGTSTGWRNENGEVAATSYRPVRSTMALMKMVSSRM